MSRRLAICTVATLAIAAATLLSAAPAHAGGGGGCHARSRTEERAARVALSGGCFTPTVAHIEAGQTLTWVNKDSYPHNVIGAVNSFAGDLAGEAAQFAQQFSQPGTYPYSCTLHPGMTGTVVVGDTALPVQRASASSAPGSSRRALAAWIAFVVALVGGSIAGGYRLGRRSETAGR